MNENSKFQNTFIFPRKEIQLLFMRVLNNTLCANPYCVKLQYDEGLYNLKILGFS